DGPAPLALVPDSPAGEVLRVAVRAAGGQPEPAADVRRQAVGERPSPAREEAAPLRRQDPDRRPPRLGGHGPGHFNPPPRPRPRPPPATGASPSLVPRRTPRGQGAPRPAGQCPTPPSPGRAGTPRRPTARPPRRRGPGSPGSAPAPEASPRVRARS